MKKVTLLENATNSFLSAREAFNPHMEPDVDNLFTQVVVIALVTNDVW